MSAFAGWVGMLPLAFIVLVVPIVVGVYVYRDAQRRSMNAVLWTLIAVLVPSLLGFVVYLLVRGSHSNLRCPRCDASVEDDFLACPHCGAKLRATCANCATPVEPEWEVCPKCARPLTHSHEGVEAPVRPKDTGLWKVLAVVVVVPALLVGLLIVGFSVSSRVGSSTLREVTAEELLTISEDSAQLETWLAGFDGSKASGAHALAYVEPGLEGGKDDYFYLIYVPGVDGVINNWNFGVTTGFMGLDPAFELDFNTDGTAPVTGETVDGKLFCATFASKNEPDLCVSCNGVDLRCTVTWVPYNPTTYTIFSSYAMEAAQEIPAAAAASQDVYVEETQQLANPSTGGNRLEAASR